VFFGAVSASGRALFRAQFSSGSSYPPSAYVPLTLSTLPFGAIELAKRNFFWNIANHAAFQENNQPQEGIAAIAD
jgi:hypothetical protein